MNIKPDILIFSVYRSDKTEAENLREHQITLGVLELDNVPHLELEGVYNGVKEKSILVKGFKHEKLVKRLAAFTNQESYLKSYGDRSSYLVFTKTGFEKFIGKLQPVSEEEAKANGSYSYNPALGQFYIAA